MKNTLGTSDKCAVCGEKIKLRFNPMDDWGIEGVMCGDCYSKKIKEYYPGEHVRVNKHLD